MHPRSLPLSSLGFSLCVFTWLPSVPLFILGGGHPSRGIKTHPSNLIVTWLRLQRLFPDEVTFLGTGARGVNIPFGGHGSAFDNTLTPFLHVHEAVFNEPTMGLWSRLDCVP